MSDRVDALETQMGNVTTTLQELALQVQQQSLILAELSKQIRKRTEPQEEEASAGDSAQSESRLAGRKVKLPLFDGDDPVAIFILTYGSPTNCVDEYIRIYECTATMLSKICKGVSMRYLDKST